jgi:hypothetical protein
MAIRKSDDIANDPNIDSRIKSTVKIEEILERYNVNKTDNILPGDEAFAYLSEKIDECIDTINSNETAVSSSGAVEKAKALNTARNIGGVSFDGTSNIDLPGVNSTGNQNTSGRAATATLAAEATALETARTIGGVSFDGSANINLPGVNTAGNQSTTGNAATSTKFAATKTIGGVSFDGSASIVPTGHKGSITTYNLTPTDFYPISSDYTEDRPIILTPNSTGAQATANNAGTFVCNVTIPEGLGPTHVVVYGSDTSRNTVRAYKNKIANSTNAAVDGGRSFAVGTNAALSGWNDGDSSTYYLTITVTTDGADSIYGGTITMR